jgi:hypothetical protein
MRDCVSMPGERCARARAGAFLVAREFGYATVGPRFMAMLEAALPGASRMLAAKAEPAPLVSPRYDGSPLRMAEV